MLTRLIQLFLALSLACAACGTTVAGEAAREKNMAERMVIGPSAIYSCGEWIDHRKNNYHFWNADLMWVLGYLSAYNMYVYKGNHPRGIFGNANETSVAAWLDDYCEKNPLSGLSLRDLISELRQSQ